VSKLNKKIEMYKEKVSKKAIDKIRNKIKVKEERRKQDATALK
jgi:hypothetical protein